MHSGQNQILNYNLIFPLMHRQSLLKTIIGNFNPHFISHKITLHIQVLWSGPNTLCPCEQSEWGSLLKSETKKFHPPLLLSTLGCLSLIDSQAYSLVFTMLGAESKKNARKFFIGFGLWTSHLYKKIAAPKLYKQSCTKTITINLGLNCNNYQQIPFFKIFQKCPLC